MTVTDNWRPYLRQDHSFIDFPEGGAVLDVGCGNGTELLELQRLGCMAYGLDINLTPLMTCRRLGLRVIRATAEEMPVKTHSLDGLVCKVVIPYTDEARALAEMGRVLKPAAHAVLCYHGVGYYLRYLLLGPSWKRRLYALRTLVNTWVYTLTGGRLPGFVGDTIYQSRRRLARSYRENELMLLKDTLTRPFLGFPVFIYHTLQKAI